MSWRKHIKNKTFSIAIEKEATEIDKDGNESVVTKLIKMAMKVL